MNCFPFLNFWKNVIIVRTRVYPSHKKFQYQKKKKLKGELIKIIQVKN